MDSMLRYRCFKAIWIVSITIALFAVGNRAASLDMERAICVSDVDWLGRHWSVPLLREVQNDCYWASELMMNTDMTEHGNGWFEFTRNTRRSIYNRYPLLSTPRKYTSGKSHLSDAKVMDCYQ